MPAYDDDLEQVGMQEAIRESLRARESNQPTLSTDQDSKELEPPVHTCQNRVNIDDRIKDMTMKAALELPLVHDLQGDTFVYIDAPQRQPEQDQLDYERYIKRYENPMLMQREILTKYSPGLAKLFGPTQQYRVLRRRKLANKLPNNVKYVIDLTPPSEGEDAVFLTTELCCSEGVRLWYQSNHIWNVSKTLVKGEEEFSSLLPRATSEGTSSEVTRSTILPLEYSPIRHRSAIERVLSTLQGADPILDSATKVWTTFAVAKNFEISHSPLEDYIIRWLRAYPNSYFLEVLPEVSLKIADGLQNYDLARDSFAILVGEEALDSLRHAREPRLYKYTRVGRRKEELPEHIHTRIEYASKSFLERLNNDFAALVNGMQWIDELLEVRKLSAYKLPDLQDTIHELKCLLKDYVRGAIYKLLCVDYDSVPGPDLHRDGGHDLLPRVDRTGVWANLRLGERILTRTYWEAVISSDILRGDSNLDIIGGWNFNGGGLDRQSHIEKHELDQGTFRRIKKSELRALVRKGQTHLPDHTHYSAQQENSAGSQSRQLYNLPDRTINRPQDQKNPGDLLSAHTSDDDLYDAERQSYVRPSPRVSFPSAVSSLPTHPIDIPKSVKRTQHFSDALSPPVKKFQFGVRTKWPFGATRDDPMAQVEKSVDGLHFTSIPPDTWPARDNVLEDSDGHEFKDEEPLLKTDPWRGYSDQLNEVNEALEDSAHKTPLASTKATHRQRAAPAESDVRVNFNNAYFENGTQKAEDWLPNFDTYFFNLEEFFSQARSYLDAFARSKLRSWDRGCGTDSLQLGIINTLVCLEDTEWKYLPLWAGGNDDGSMGVYNDDLPTAEHGFTTAGPEVHDGLTPANSIKAPSEYDVISAGGSASTFNASTATNRGFSDTIRRGHIHAVDSTDGSMSDSFTMVTPSVDSDDEETFARKQIEAQEQIEEAEEAAANGAHRVVEGKGRMVDEDESYADLFDGEEEEDGNDTDRAEVNDEDEDDDEDEDMVMV